MDFESAEIFKICQDINKIVFNYLLPKNDPTLLVDHIEYILNQGLQALIVVEGKDNVD